LISIAAVYDETECGSTLGEYEGFVNSSYITDEKKAYVLKHNLQLDCMWIIEVEEGWKVKERMSFVCLFA